jgi:hypothetical protein
VPKGGWWRTRTWAAVVALLVVGCGPDAEQSEEEGDETSDNAAVMEHELEEETLWISEDGDAEHAAAEFLEHVLGWSTEPVARVPDGSEEMMLEPTIAMVDAEGPDGQRLLLQMRRGVPQHVGEPPGDDMHRWHVESVTTDETPAQTLDEDTHTLVVHQIPDEQHHSVLLLHVDDETEAHLLDHGELQPGAETAEIDLAALGVEEFEPDSSFLLTTALLVHFHEDGQTLAAEGHPIRAQPTPR